ncbi:ABC transporter permease [Streptomyces sp. NPDC059578]|uniref:ABC transporter permease n=1 Tax=unclassified Streptomyces TaxID=2593676 RepID=UPI003665D198
MTALARAELTLLVRSKGTLFAAAFVPLILPFSMRGATEQMDLEDTGLSIGTILLPAAIGFSLLFAVYMALTAIFVTRREELVLKRLRVGELRDVEILGGAALPSVCIALVQTLVLVIGCMVLLDVGAPQAPHLAVLGLLLGIVLCAALGAVTAAFSRSSESAQVTVMPLVLVSMIGSGITVPLEIFPDGLARVGELLPLTGAITLVRGGWTGALSGGETLTALATAVAWTALAVFAVRRWFRWEPRH